MDQDKIRNLIKLTQPTDLTATASTTAYPWHAEADQYACEAQLEHLYRNQVQKRPQFAWTDSPLAMFKAHTFLRELQTKTRQATIQALIPFETNQIDTGAKRSFLEAVMDRDITVSVGASMKTLFRWGCHDQYDNLFRSIESLPSMHGQFQTSQKVTTPATAWDAVMYPGEYLDCIGPTGGLSTSVYAIMPFVKLCWICRRPTVTRQDENGFLHHDTLPAMEFRDGFQVFAKNIEEEEIIDGEYLEVGEERPELPAHEEPAPWNQRDTI